MKLLLDTSVLIDTLCLRRGRKELLAELVRQGHRLMTTSINVAEVYSEMRPEEERSTITFLESLECFSLDGNAFRSTRVRGSTQDDLKTFGPKKAKQSLCRTSS